MTDQQQDQPKRRRLFARTRERIVELEKTNDDFRAIVEHLQDHKETYMVSAGCLVVGFLTGKHRRRSDLSTPTVINTFSPVFAPGPHYQVPIDAIVEQ